MYISKKKFVPVIQTEKKKPGVQRPKHCDNNKDEGNILKELLYYNSNI